jgi:putative restriction endonuclease
MPISDQIQRYVWEFSTLRVDKSSGISAPHKPILLLSVLQALKSGLIRNRFIEITPELVALFKSNWSLLVMTEHQCRMSYPFFHLKSSKFWKLHPKPGYEKAIIGSTKSPSLNQLMEMITFAELNEELFELMRQDSGNGILREVLLQTYFPQAKNELVVEQEQQDLFREYEQRILVEDPITYAIETKRLLEKNEQEEVFIRGGAFKREIPKIYDYTCCISRLRISSSSDISMIDACHIRPFAESYDDTITNGIALSPSLHRAFDRGLISISAEYRVMVSSQFSESEVAHSIRPLSDQEILLPQLSQYKPSQENLKWHREIRFLV